MSKYFYHGITGSFIVIPKLLKIFQTGGLKCRRLLGQEPLGYNGLDYISICKKYSPEDYINTTMDNAFYSFVQHNFCLILSDELPAIKTKPAGKIKWDQYSDSMLSDTKIRISDMFDEWQVYEKIPLSAIVGIGIPVECMASLLKNFPPNCETMKNFRKLIEIANELGIDIVDSNGTDFVEKYEKTKQESNAKIYQISKQLEEVISRE